MKRILICEDESAIREFVVFNLQRDGFEVIEAKSGEEALELYEKQTMPVDIALLDVMLPGMDGFTVCRELREKDPTLGIVMLTARSQEEEKVQGLHLGADDYITKPFGIAELLARLGALYRRVQVLREKNGERYMQQVERSGFVLDLRGRVLRKQDEIIDLTQTEFQVLEFFFTHDGGCHKRKEILRYVWGEEYSGDEKVVDVNLRRLRMKIEKDPSNPRHIITVWGKGYQWQD